LLAKLAIDANSATTNGKVIDQYGSVKPDLPGTPLPKGGTRIFSKSPLLSGDARGISGE